MSRLERLINLVAALLAAERLLSREELMARVPGYTGEPASARRAFERDKDALRSMGVPLEVRQIDTMDATSPEGYRIPREQYELPDPGLTSDELAALHLAVTVVRLEGGGSGGAALWKLGGAPGEEGSAPPVALPGSEQLPVLFSAIAERRTVRFTHKGADERIVDPYRLGFRNGRWYLAGWDRGRDEPRTFRLDRMTNAEAIGEPGGFERRSGASATPPPAWQWGEEEPIEALLLVDRDQAMWATANLGADGVHERRDDGSVVFRLRVTNREPFRNLVLGFLDHAEVLEPVALRSEVVEWLRAVR